MKHLFAPHLVLALTLSICGGWSSIAAQEALSTGNTEAQRAYDQMVLALSKGDLTAINRMAQEHFISPLGRIDSQDAQLIRRRQQDLRDSLKRLSPELQQEALALLDQKARDYFIANDQNVNGLSYFLPSPFAIQQLNKAADYWFDHGEFNDFLQVHYLLQQYNENYTKDKRVAVAEQLIGNGFQLYRPGLLLSEHGPIIDHRLGQSVHWSIHNAYLHACDPWLSVLWQRPLGRFAEIQTGPQHVLIKDKNGFTIIDHTGKSKSLPPISQAKSLSVSSHHAWFAIKQRIFSYHLQHGSIQSFELPETPILAPLDDGQRSLWLGKHHLYFIDGEQQHVLKHTLKHGLSVNKQWRLQLDGDHIFLVGPDASYRIKTYDDSLKDDPTATLLASNQASDAWAQCTNPNDYIEQWITAPDAFIMAALPRLLELELNEQQRTFIKHRLHRLAKTSLSSKELTSINASDPTFLLPMSKTDYLDQAEDYQHAMSIAGMLKYALKNEQQQSIAPQHVDPAKPLVKSQSIAMPNNGIPDCTFAAQLQQNGDVLVTAHDQSGSLLWRHHIPKFGYHPSLSFVVRPEHIIVTLGMTRCLVFNTYTGDLLVNSDMPPSFNDPKYIHVYQNRYLCSSGPTGIRNKVVTHKPLGEQTHNQLSSINGTIRWMLPIGKDIIYSNGKQAYRLGDQRTLKLPEALLSAKHVEWHPRGIIHDRQLYPWN